MYGPQYLPEPGQALPHGKCRPGVFVCSGLPLSGTVGGRRLPNQPLELFGKIAGAGKTALQSDFCDGKAGCGQLFGSHQKPALAQIFHRPAVQVTAEHPLAFPRAHAGAAGQVAQGDGIFQVAVNPAKDLLPEKQPRKSKGVSAVGRGAERRGVGRAQSGCLAAAGKKPGRQKAFPGKETKRACSRLPILCHQTKTPAGIRRVFLSGGRLGTRTLDLCDVNAAL